MSLPRYAEYKDSGIDWVVTVPAHWEICALKRIANLQSGENITAEQIEEVGPYPVYGGNGLRGFTLSFTHEGRFALIGRQGALCGNVNYSAGKFWASEHAIVVTPAKPVETTWLGEMLRVMNLNQYSVSAAQPGLSVDLISKIGVPCPPIEEQTAIATFINRETAKIDALIAEQEKLVALLAEKRQAAISHAVTRGLNPNVPMKDSGVPWLGEVPAHWGVSALGYLAAIDTGATPDRGEAAYWNGSIPWVKTGEINWAPIRATEETISDEGLASSATKLAKPGTLLMAMYGQGVTRGRVALLEIEATYNQACAAILFGPRIKPEFGRYFFMAAYDYVRDMGNETSQMNLSAGLIAKIKLAIPPAEEQKDIIRFLDSAVRKQESLRREAELAIRLLRERRSALISAAVTGQIDVRGVTAQQINIEEAAAA